MCHGIRPPELLMKSLTNNPPWVSFVVHHQRPDWQEIWRAVSQNDVNVSRHIGIPHLGALELLKISFALDGGLIPGALQSFRRRLQDGTEKIYTWKQNGAEESEAK